MAKAVGALYALLFVAAVGNAYALSYHSPFRHTPSKSQDQGFRIRDESFEWEPLIAQCPSECAVLEQAFGDCRDSACYCTDAVAAGYRECMVCSIDLVNNPELQTNAQQNLDEYELNCESGGHPVASLSVAVAAPTAQPAAASPAPAVATSWAQPGSNPTISVYVMPTYTSPTIASTGYVQPAACSVSADANSFYAACWGSAGENTGNPFAVSGESAEPTAIGEDTPTATASHATSTADGPPDSDQGAVASPSSIASSPSVTFNPSSTSAPSASGINAQDNTTSGGDIHAKVSFPVLTSLVPLIGAVMWRII